MYLHHRDCVRTSTVQSHVCRVAGMERDGRGPLQRTPIDRSPGRRDRHGRSDEQRLGTNRSAAVDLHIDGNISVADTDRQNRRKQFGQGEQGRLV